MAKKYGLQQMSRMSGLNVIHDVNLPKTALRRHKTELYKTQTEEAHLQHGRLSTGELVDCVLQYQLPEEEGERAHIDEHANEPPSKDDSEDLKDAKERAFYEDGLTNVRLRIAIQSTTEKLAAAGLSPAEKARLQEHLKLQTDYAEQTQLIIEHEVAADLRTMFVKVHAPFRTLCFLAEETKLMLPLKPEYGIDLDETIEPPTGRVSRARAWVNSFFISQTDIDEDDFFSAEFKFAHLDRFRDCDEPDTFFSPAHRLYLVKHLLESTRYSQPKEDHSNVHQMGISKLVRKKTYTKVYALHDGNLESDAEHDMESQRRILYDTWATWKNFFRPQPIERIRAYFGEKVTFYFAWLGFYTKWLLLPALVGLLVFLYGFSEYQDQADAAELCNSNITMCAACKTCEYWELADACTAYEFGYVFDNGGTVFFAIFMALWATCFLEYWKRANATYAYDWDVQSFKETEPQRPHFKGITQRKHPVTGHVEKHFPSYLRRRRYIASALTVALMLSLVIWSVLGVIMFRLAIRTILYEKTSGSLQAQSGAVTSALSAILSLILIIVLGNVYQRLAIKLTEWENHSKQSTYEYHLTLKIFCFQFVNYYASLVYIAFFKGQVAGRPGEYNTVFGVRQEQCPTYGCLLELTIQLSIIMVGKQAIGNVKEFLIPYITSSLAKRKVAKMEKDTKHDDLSPWQDQAALSIFPAMGLFPEYLEMTIQFGFITLFVAAFPLAPFFALLNNVFEVRIDAQKFLISFQRPFADRADSIGVWQSILTTVGMISVISNAFVIAIPSTFIPKLVYKSKHGNSLSGYINSTLAFSAADPASDEPFAQNCFYRGFYNDAGEPETLHYEVMMARLGFVIIFEHFVFGFKFLLQAFIPDVPNSIQLAMAREEYQAKLALEEALYGTEFDNKAKPTRTDSTVSAV